MRETSIFTDAEQKAIAYAPKAPAVLSLLSSLCVIHFFIMHPEKRVKMYHRLAFAMSLYGIVLSIVFITGTSAFPTDSLHSYGAMGSTVTCTLQGMGAQLSCSGIPLYYSSLSIYSYLSIKSQFKEEKIKWIEPWIHGTINSYTVMTTFVLVLTKNLNPSGPACWIETFPERCGQHTNIPCKRGNPTQIGLFSWLFSGIPVYGAMFFTTYIMIVIYKSQVRKEDIHNLQRRKQLFETARRKKSRIIAIQAFLYLMAYYTAFILPLATRTTMYFGLKTNNWMRIIGSCAVSLQSFFFTLVYLGLQISSGNHERQMCENSYLNTLKKRISQTSTTGILDEPSDTDNCPTETRSRRRSFSIFDGSKKSTSPWGMFLYDDDSDDDSVSDIIQQTAAMTNSDEKEQEGYETSSNVSITSTKECPDLHAMDNHTSIETKLSDTTSEQFKPELFD